MSDYNDIYGNDEQSNNMNSETTGNTEERTEQAGTYGNPYEQPPYSGYRAEYHTFSSADQSPEDRYGFQQEPGKKRGRAALAVLLVMTAVISLIFGTTLVVRGVLKKSHTSGDSVEVVSSGEDIYEEVTTEGENTSGFLGLIEGTRPESSVDQVDLSGNGIILTDVSSVVRKVMPCLVAITDNLEVTSTYNPYQYFFGYSQGSSTPQEKVASGTGVIIGCSDTELLIVTNNHVVDNAGNYSSYSVTSTGLNVQFEDGTIASAMVKGTDSEMDLAVISVSLSEISEETKDAIAVAVIGSSDDLEIGQGVICIGNAMGYGQSVTTGIVSAKDRAVSFEDGTRHLLQTDAAINPGNSGGGMFNSVGELIGINSAKYSDTNVEGMCFAIPISSAKEIIEDLMNREIIPEEEQGYLGINGETVPSAYIQKYGYPAGVSITRITANSPADAAGLQIYDIITAINGKEVTTMNELKTVVNSYPAGTTVTVTLQRPDKRSFVELNVDVTLASLKEIS